MFKSFFARILVNVESFFDITFKAALFIIGLFTLINGIKFFFAVKSLIGSASLMNIVEKQHYIFSFLTSLGILDHGTKVNIVQIAMLHMFAIIASELALLSVIAGLVLIKNAVMPVIKEIQAILREIGFVQEYVEKIEAEFAAEVKERMAKLPNN
ncbi:MAG: hypothetical protein M1276_00545 [Deltaproteobacteria bacterium]|jgi:hypothetical protein|nr:hypothetical protein [Deltaproteobacteria bacterium]